MILDIKGVIFDLDGTVIDSMWLWKDIDIKFLEKRGLILPEDLQNDIEGMSFTETAQYFKNRFNLSESVDEIKAEWNDMTLDSYRNRVPLKEGILEFLDILKSNNIKIGLGTSSSPALVREVLKKHKIDHYFESIRTSCEVERGKPYPDVFIKVAEDLDLSPNECLVFEDTYSGVLAGKRAGMKVYAIADEHSLPNRDQITKLADKFITSFYDIA